MEKVFEGFFSPQVLFFCLFVWGIALVLRRIAESLFKTLKRKKYWNELLLPMLPVLVGVLTAFMAKQYPYPPPFNASLSARLFFGFVSGGASGYIYRIIKAFLVTKEAQLNQPNPPKAP